MTLDAIARSVKDTLKEEVWSYPGKKGCAIGNGIRTLVGYAGFQYFTIIYCRQHALVML